VVKLQKHKAYTYKTEDGKKIDHFKHLVVIPEEMLAELGWQNGLELKTIVRRNSLVLQPSSQITEGSKTSDAQS